MREERGQAGFWGQAAHETRAKCFSSRGGLSGRSTCELSTPPTVAGSRPFPWQALCGIAVCSRRQPAASGHAWSERPSYTGQSSRQPRRLMSAIGPKRRFVALQRYVRSRGWSRHAETAGPTRLTRSWLMPVAAARMPQYGESERQAPGESRIGCAILPLVPALSHVRRVA